MILVGKWKIGVHLMSIIVAINHLKSSSSSINSSVTLYSRVLISHTHRTQTAYSSQFSKIRQNEYDFKWESSDWEWKQENNKNI